MKARFGRAPTKTPLPKCSRAVELAIEPGVRSTCVQCDQPISFSARCPRNERRRIVCNVYGRKGKADVWDHIEEFHLPCYEQAGKPYGDPG